MQQNRTEGNIFNGIEFVNNRFKAKQNAVQYSSIV